MEHISPEVYALRPWYHDFASLGLQTRFPEHFFSRLWRMAAPVRRLFDPGYVEKGDKFSLRQLFAPRAHSHQTNQAQKEAYILPFLAQSVGALGDTPRCLDLFCADGYYTCHLSRLAPGAIITGVDLDEQEIARAEIAARLLQAPNATFVHADVWSFVRDAATPYDLVLCTGGLYHLRDPHGFLESLARICTGYVVIQSVITLETEAADFFVSPAPGWKHGSRFTYAGLRGWLQSLGWEIVAEARNELSGNARPCDRGSAYVLCRVS